jgi:hypothetical protein
MSDLTPFASPYNRLALHLLGEVLRGVGLRGAESPGLGRRGGSLRGVRTLGAELRRRRELPTAVGARSGQRRGAFLAELCACLVLVLTLETLHHEVPGPPRLTLHKGGVTHGPPSGSACCFPRAPFVLSCSNSSGVTWLRRCDPEPSPCQSHREQWGPLELSRIERLFGSAA